jgi:3-oxoacyl-[acyl-carrier-protein] synthase II
MRIWVTGIGVVSPLARGAGATMDRLCAGERGQRPLELFQHLHAAGAPPPAGFRPGVTAEVPDLFVREVALPGQEEAWSRTDAMSVLAAREALEQAKIHPAETPVDLILGGTTAGMFENEDALAAFPRDPMSVRASPQMISHPLSSTADHVHAALGPFRRVRTVCSACTSSANAIILGAAWIHAGLSRAVLVGGADGLCRLTVAGFGALSALSPELCRPFDRRRTGLNLGEGAGLLLLEPEDLARARGARPIVELRGFAVGAEAHHITNPEGDGGTAARIMRSALSRGRITAADLDYVNAHGTATLLNDAMEAAALAQCLGGEVTRVAVSSSKGQIGHTLAAAGAIEAAITAMAIERGVLPPTIGLEEVDPACPLEHVTVARKAKVRAAMSNSFGFGGTDSVLVLTAPEAFPPIAAPPPRRVVVTGAATVGPLGVLGVLGSQAYLEPGPALAPGPIGIQFAEHLDVLRARRMDRSGKFTTLSILAAQADAGLTLDEVTAREVGAIGGSAFGSIDGSTAFIRRLYDKGAKFASPADFPNLLPSSPVGHASIYAGLRGPVLAVSDLDVTAECAAVTAVELLTAGIGEAIFAGSAEESSAMVERFFSPLCSGVLDRGPRSEGAAMALFEAEPWARARGARVLARVLWWTSWRGDNARPLVGAPPPLADAEVFLGRNDARVERGLEGSPWALVPRRSVAARAGDHEAAGGFALVAAIGQIAVGARGRALVLGVGVDRGYAILLERDGIESQG